MFGTERSEDERLFKCLKKNFNRIVVMTPLPEEVHDQARY